MEQTERLQFQSTTTLDTLTPWLVTNTLRLGRGVLFGGVEMRATGDKQTQKVQQYQCTVLEDWPERDLKAGDTLICHEADGTEDASAFTVKSKGRVLVVEATHRDFTKGRKGRSFDRAEDSTGAVDG